MAEPAEVAEEVERLAIHCRPPLMGLDERALWLEDWCRDLAGYPIEAVREACRRWRNGEDRKFPLPGQLRPLIAAAMLGEDRPAVERAEPWRPISEADYQALTLAEKIRHQRILCAQAMRKAGPMWGRYGPIAAADMSDDWRRWRGKAGGHDAEARRLSAMLEHEGSPA